jgi:hypothetical protein
MRLHGRTAHLKEDQMCIAVNTTWRRFVCRVRQRFAIVDMARSSRVGIVVPRKTGLLCWSGMWYSNRFVGLVACIL